MTMTPNDYQRGINDMGKILQDRINKLETENERLKTELEQVKNCSIPDVRNLVLLAKPSYKAKDGTIKRGIEIEGKYYAPQNDC